MLGTFILYAVLTGLMLSLGWISWSTPAFMFVAFVPLWVAAYKIKRAGARHGAWIMLMMSAVAFGVWNAVDTFWLKNATWAGFFIASGANTAMMSIVMMLSYFVMRRRGMTVGLVFWIALWVSFEKMHTEWELSWPWLTLGNGFANYAGLVQWYEYTGVFGGSLWVLISNALIFHAWRMYVEKKPKKLLYRFYGFVAAWVLVPMCISWTISQKQTEPWARVEAVALQPNIDPYDEKFSATDVQMADTLAEMASSVMLPSTRLVVAPETVLPEYKSINMWRLNPVVGVMRNFSAEHDGATVVAGGSFIKYIHDKDSVTSTANKVRGADVWYDVYNSAVQVTPLGEDIYHKSRLVPGVEHFPYRWLLEGLLGDTMMDFGGMTGSNVTQADRAVFRSLGDTLALAPIICYESVYGQYVTDYVKKGANVLCIITNDGWWGNTEGHRQHLSFARLRAIETRLPVIRSANTGISAFIAPSGKITTSTVYGEKKALVGTLDIPRGEPTFYVRYGDFMARPMPWLALGIFLFSVLPVRGKK